MEKFVIKGGNPLYGEISIGGAKNAAIAIIPAAVLVKGVCRLENMPKISDVTIQLDILKELGAKVSYVDETTVDIDCTEIHEATESAYELMRGIRASYYLLGSLLGRYGKASVSMPGGCDFGIRPIDQHIKGFEALGAHIEVRNGKIEADAMSGLHSANIYFDTVSVGATMNVMLAAAMAKGTTVMENVAKEPHIVDLANFLNSMGASISGAGTDVIKIKGVESLHGGVYSIIPDQIEAGTYMAAVAATGGSLLIKNVIPRHLECITNKLVDMNVQVEELDDAVRVTRENKQLAKTNIKTLPYPGFPTDMQPQLAVVLCLAEGTSIVTEGIWDDRFRYMDELRRMGAVTQVDGKVAIIEGVRRLTGAKVKARDLRAGAAMVIAGMAADGITEVEDIQFIERGYEDIVKKLKAVGADICRICEEESAE
ncbi:MAG: UDP-N-acetylglucosamine 1-carboxyvinyltransferase [Ruminococcaceae bacterium]|nr:UDP-N-acetylglucosamine 1-carboxyvinyltransferase [Oscillospiraceae bacterium]